MTENMETGAGPYRSVTYIDKQAAIKAQMIGAVALLYEWKRWRPIIAGGALWSWAAGNVANDVDIFARSTWWSRRRARAMYGKSTLDHATVNKSIPTGYGDFISGKGLHVFRTKLHTHGSAASVPAADSCTAAGCTKVDFVLSRRGEYGYGAPGVNHSIFDYEHVQVAYGLAWYSTDGASAYAAGRLKQLHADARNKNYVIGKVQISLWNNPEATTKIAGVMQELAAIAGRPLAKQLPFPRYIQ